MSTESFPILNLSGTPREQGREHGGALRKSIALVREQWRASLAARFGVHPDTFIETLLAETKFVDAMKRWTPSLVEEVEGIAEGSGRPLDETMVYQFLDEEWWFSAIRFRKPVPAADKCSVIAVRGADGHAPILAQNMDLHAFDDGGQAVINVTSSDGTRATVMTRCGMLGLCGANEMGIAVAVNTLWQLPSAADGLPVACVTRSILAQRSLAEASTWIREPRHASGQHYLIGSPDGFVSFEASSTAANQLNWEESSVTFAHTNHPLSRNKPQSNPAEDNSRGRYATLCQGITGSRLTTDQVKSLLSDRTSPHPISVRPKPGDTTSVMTFASIVMELTRPPKLEMTAGPPCSNGYLAVESQ